MVESSCARCGIAKPRDNLLLASSGRLVCLACFGAEQLEQNDRGPAHEWRGALVYPDRVHHKGIDYLLSEVTGIDFTRQATTTEQVPTGIKMTTTYQTRLVIHFGQQPFRFVNEATSFFGIGKSKKAHAGDDVLAIYAFIGRLTLSQRLSRYIADLERQGFLSYDGKRIFLDGRVESGRQVASLHDVRLVHLPFSLTLLKDPGPDFLTRMRDRWLGPAPVTLSTIRDEDCLMAFLASSFGVTWEHIKEGVEVGRTAEYRKRVL